METVSGKSDKIRKFRVSNNPPVVYVTARATLYPNHKFGTSIAAPVLSVYPDPAWSGSNTRAQTENSRHELLMEFRVRKGFRRLKSSKPGLAVCVLEPLSVLYYLLFLP